MCSEYNGWPNYETWNANLWIDNEEGVYLTAWEQCKQAFEYCEDEGLPKFQTVYRLGEILEQLFVDVWFSDEEVGPKGDAIQSYLKTIDWNRIAQHYYDELEYEAKKEKKND